MTEYKDKELLILCEKIVEISRWNPPKGSSFIPPKYQIYEMIEEYLKTRMTEPKWIPISERMPEDISSRHIIYANCHWWKDGSRCNQIPVDATHWMEIELPKEEKPVDPDWKDLERSHNCWNTTFSCVSTYEIVEDIYKFLKAKYGK